VLALWIPLWPASGLSRPWPSPIKLGSVVLPSLSPCSVVVAADERMRIYRGGGWHSFPRHPHCVYSHIPFVGSTLRFPRLAQSCQIQIGAEIKLSAVSATSSA